MRRLALWALQAALLVGSGAALCAAQEPGQQPTSGANWFNRLVPFGKKEEPKILPKKAPLPAPVPVESAAARREREKKILDRRQAACDKLRDIAFTTKDEALMRMANQLSERAFQVYLKQTNAQPVRDLSPSDEQILANHLPRTEPTSPTAGLTAAGRDDDRRTAARRDQP